MKAEKCGGFWENDIVKKRQFSIARLVFGKVVKRENQSKWGGGGTQIKEDFILNIS